MNLQQQYLFSPLLVAYASGQSISNTELYDKLASDEVIPPGAFLEKVPVGSAQAMHNPARR